MKLRLGDVKLDEETTRGSGKKPPASRNRQRWHKLLIFSLFLVLSLTFWLVLSLQNKYQMKIEVAVVYDSLPSGIGYDAHAVPESISFTVEDIGLELLSYSFTKFSPIVLKTQGRKQKGDVLTFANGQLQEELRKQLSSSTRILNSSPSEISLRTYTRHEKKLPVVLGFAPPVVAGYLLTETLIEPAVLSVWGDEKQLDEIAEIETADYTLNPVKGTVEFEVGLNLPVGLDCKTERVKVTLKSELLTEKSFELPIGVVDAPEGYTLRPLPGRAVLYVTIPSSRFATLLAEDFALGVSYKMEPESTSRASGHASLLEVELIKKPNYPIRYRIEPSVVQYILETNGQTEDIRDNGGDR